MQLLRERQDAFLVELIEKGFADSDLIDLVFDVISEFAPERRTKFIERFLANNKDFDRFRLLQIEPSHWSWSGSQVPVLQSRASYLESLLPLLNTVDLLEHKQHM